MRKKSAGKPKTINAMFKVNVQICVKVNEFDSWTKYIIIFVFQTKNADVDIVQCNTENNYAQFPF